MRKVSVKKYIILLLVLGVVCVSLVCFKNVNNNYSYNSKANMEIDVFFDGEETPICIKAETINKINEDFFDVELNIDNKTAIVDDKEYSLAEILGVSDEELDTVISSSSFKKFLENNLTGDVEYKDGIVEISNPYSTNVLIVETENPSIFNDENIVEATNLIDDMYYVKYNSAQNTKKGFDELSNNKQVINISRDEKISICEEDIEVQIDAISSAGDYAWSRKATGMDTYTNYLNLKGNTLNVYVAVLDTGIYSAHEVFKGTTTADRIDFTYSKNFLTDPATTDVVDDNGHGTNVAGLIAESTPNTVKIVPLKIMNSEGKGVLSAVYKGISAVYQNVDVVNVSLGSKVENMSPSSLRDFNSFLRKVKEAGVVVCCAAGNDGLSSVEYPAYSDHALGVSSIDEDKTLSSFSNYGSPIDYAMPGYNLVLPDMDGVDSYSVASGTSFSSPCLAAAAALVKSEYPNASFSDVVAKFNENIEDLGTAGKDNFYGYGMVNFNVNKFSKPVIVSAEAINTTWKKVNTINIKAVSSSTISNYAVTRSNVSPASSEWKSAGYSNTLIASLDTDYSGTNYIWVKDSNGNVTSQSLNVGLIDNTSPEVVSSISLVNVSHNSAKFSVTLKDTQSGMARVEWHVDKQSGGQGIVISQEATSKGTTENAVFEQEFTGLTPNTSYYIYAYGYDMLNNEKVISSYSFSTLSDNINVFFTNKSNVVDQIDFDANPANVLASKKLEFEQEINNIKNNYFTNNNENIIFEDYEDLFISSNNTYSYPRIRNYNLITNYSSDSNGNQVKYYTLEYDTCTLKKSYDFSDLTDITINYGENNEYLTKLNLNKDLFVISTNDRDIANVTVDSDNNVYVNSSEYAGQTQVTFTLPESSLYTRSSKTITVKVNPITITAKSATIENKYKNNDTNATVTNVSFNGLLSGDSLVLGRDYSVLAYFENADAGLNKKVYVSIVLNNTNLAKKYKLTNTDLIAYGNILDTTISILKGDLDRNGVVDANDASMALEIYKAENATLEDILIGDMDDNNIIDANDASLILEVYKTNN